MSRTYHIFLTILILTISALNADGKDSLSYAGPAHRITAEIRPAYNIPTHKFYRGGNPSGKAIGPVTSYHLKYSFTRPGTYQGIGFGINDFHSRDLIGLPVALYIFQGVRLLDISPGWSFGYEWNLGLSYGWKATEVVQSKSNICINVGLPFTWRPVPEWEIQIGPEYTHFSNGDTSYPNGGANTFGLRIGISRIYGKDCSESIGKHILSSEESLKESGFEERVCYDTFIYGAWRAGRIIEGYRLHLINEPFALGGISFSPLYRLNRDFLAGPSLDIQADTSTGLYAPVMSADDQTLESYSSPGIWKQISAGLSARVELEMPFFSINIGAGYNFIRSGKDVKRFYTTYNLKTFITRKTYACIGYRLSAAQYTHNLMFGLGFRF